MNPSEIFILRPVATTLLMVAILLAGMFAYNFLPLSALPEVDYPTIQVQTFYPGASPEVMTSAVTAPLERQFGQMPGLNQMTSASSGGASVITLQFNLDLSLDIAEQEVQAAINAGSNLLPQDLPVPPVYAKVNPADAPIMTLAVTSKSLPLIEIEDLVETRLAQKLSQQPGVGLVSISGGQRPAIRIQFNPGALAAYGLNIDDLRTTLNNNNTNTPKGAFDGPQQSSTINANDQIDDAAKFADVIVAYRNGNPVRVSDVASVRHGPENSKIAAWANSTRAIILNIQRQPGANVIQVVDTIKTLLPRLRASLPVALDVTVLSDRTTTIRASVEDVEFELGLAVVLVVLVIFVFLRNLPATVIPSLSVPLSLVGTLVVMYLLKFSLDNLSLMALTISTGFVVDDAIVMIENIARYIEEGEAPLQAALRGSRQIGFTIISLTVSLIAVLIPLLFMGDVVGRLFHEFAITLAVTIIISAFVALTLVPMLCAKLLRHRTVAQRTRFDLASERGFNWIIKQYARALDVVLEHQPLTLLAAIATRDILKNQYQVGTSSRADFITADNQVLSTEAQAIDVGVARAQYEHAIAVLTGRPPYELSIPRRRWATQTPPRFPVTVPSRLLERRPDIAAAERQLQQLNALVGVAVANFYPNISLTGALTFIGPQPWPVIAANEAWSIIGGATQTMYDGGLLDAQLQAAKASYQQGVANYRQTVLTAFQQVEDQLAAIRILALEAERYREAVKEARDAVGFYLNQYRVGTVAFTSVVTAQATLLSNEQSALTARQNLFVASVSLIQSLGGGWGAASLPAIDDLSAIKAPPLPDPISALPATVTSTSPEPR